MTSPHSFHIPVLGISYSANTPILVGHLGISSVISLVDDLLLEKLRRYYSECYHIDYQPIAQNDDDHRARRITAYLNVVNEIVQKNLERIKKMNFFENNEKDLYFSLLQNSHPLKQAYLKLKECLPGNQRTEAEKILTNQMVAGDIDVNIMVKLDHLRENETNPDRSDAKAALRGFAQSNLESSIVLSAGINPNLYGYMTNFQDFYRDLSGKIKKKIILKISDFRSAIIQEKFLAKKGLEISEYRLESGLNCGGHAFEANGRILPLLINEFNEKRHLLGEQVRPLIQSFYKKMGWELSTPEQNQEVRLSVQGGVGTSGEHQRLIGEYNVQSVGWGTPFLLVPEATSIDEATRTLLANAKEEDLYLSQASPLGVLFNNIKGVSAQTWMKEQAAAGCPGSYCSNGFARLNNEFGEFLCVASKKYQALKREAIKKLPPEEQKKELFLLDEKECICHHLTNSIFMALGMVKDRQLPVSICPGPNLAWFNRTYSLQEMVDHIYGQGPCLTPKERPHMFAQEITINTKLLIDKIQQCQTVEIAKGVWDYYQNLEEGFSVCELIAKGKSYANENLASLSEVIEEQKKKLQPYLLKLQNLIS